MSETKKNLKEVVPILSSLFVARNSYNSQREFKKALLLAKLKREENERILSECKKTFGKDVKISRAKKAMEIKALEDRGWKQEEILLLKFTQKQEEAYNFNRL